MNIYLQLFIPLALTFVILLLIMIVRKYLRADSIVLCTVVLLLAVATGIPGFMAFSESHTAELTPKQIAEMTQQNLTIAEQYIVDGNLEEAKIIVNEIKKTDASSFHVLLTSARITALERNWKIAAPLYKTAQSMFGENEKFPNDELEKAEQIAAVGNSVGNDAIISYLESKGIDPNTYGIASGEFVLIDESEAAETILKRIKDRVEEKKEEEHDSDESGIASCAKYASKLTSAFNSYLENSTVDAQSVEKSVRRLESTMKEIPELSANKFLRIARLKGLILLRDYKKIAESIDAESEIEELMIVSELYMAGFIKDKDFSDEYVEAQSRVIEDVIDQCHDILDGELSEASKSVRKSYKEKIEILEELLDADAIGILRQNLRERAFTRKDAMTSKVYLELAKIEKYLENETIADEYITKAFGTVSLCDDDEYTVPMNSLLGIIEGNSEGGTEDLKKIAEFVSEVVDSSLPLEISASLLAEAAPYPTEDGVWDNSQIGGTFEKRENLKEAPGEEFASEQESFTEYMTDVVSKKTAVINIGVIDKSDFPNVKARIQVHSSKIAGPDDLLTSLRIFDCNSGISEFKVENLEFDTSRIILLCDVSGSMSDSVSSLKNAITSFARNMNENEEISVIGFDDSIKFEHAFSSNPDKISSYAENIGAYGGTDMFSALKYAMKKFPSDVNSNNIVILMTDGEDNNPKGESTIRNELGALCADRSVTVYTLGLGSSVDTAYLTLLADAGNGSFLYVDSDTGLNHFYDFIHQQLTNQYILKYTAKNTTLNKRKLEISVEGELGSAEKIYYLEDPEYSDQSPDSYDAYVVEDTNIKMYGLSTKFIYRASKDQSINLKGEGFDPGEDITVKISGNVSYILTSSYVDANTYPILIPANVSTGTYDVEIAVRGESFTMKDELTIAVHGTEKTFRYGSYEFTAMKSYKNSSGATVLSGNVTMNGWLRFKGDVTIVGEYLDSGRVTLRDSSGSYIPYADHNSRGLANFMADKGISLPISPLGDFTLYTDEYTPGGYEDFPVQPVDRLENLNMAFFFVENFSISLYPDCAKVEGINFTYSFPFQKQLLRNLPDNFDQYLESSGSTSTGMILSATDIGLVAELHYNKLDKVDFSMVSLPLRITKVDVSIDTLLNNYTLGGEVQFKSFQDMDSLALEFGVKSGKFDSISLEVGGDYSVPIMKTPVPITISDFGFELDGFSEWESNRTTLTNLLGTTVAFKFQTNVGDVSSMLPGLRKLITDDELAAATLKNCKLSATLKTFSFKFEADVYLFTVLDIGHCEIEAGSFQYSNDLLHLGGDTQYGLRAALTIGSTWDTTNCYVKAEGTAELVLGYPYTGLWLDGDLGFDIGWWILKVDWNVSGDFLVAVYKNSADQAQFSMIVRGTNNKGEYSGFHLYITPTTGMDIYHY